MRTVFLKRLMATCLVLVTFVLMGFGCTIYMPWNLEESKTRTVMYKPDANHYAGQMAVCWDNRIYYVSDETGDDGIHSMKTDGSDVRFEFEAPKITRLIATDDAFYYVGVYKIEEKNHQLFALFKKEHDLSELEMLPMVYEYAESTCDAYITQDRAIAVIEIAGTTSSAGTQETLNFIGVDRIVEINNGDKYFFDNKEVYSFNVYADELGAYAFSGEITSYHDGENVQIEQMSVVDTLKGISVMSYISHESMQYIKLLYVLDNTFVFGEYNKLVLMDRDTREKYKKIVVENIEEDMWIDYVFECDNGFMAIAKQENRNNDKLFFINTDTDETAELMKLNDKVLIDVRENKVLYAQGNFIRCQAVNELSLGDMIYEIRMPENVMRNNVFEIAGDWLFIHKHVNNVEWATNQLLYKINLKTQEVIDVR